MKYSTRSPLTVYSLLLFWPSLSYAHTIDIITNNHQAQKEITLTDNESFESYISIIDELNTSTETDNTPQKNLFKNTAVPTFDGQTLGCDQKQIQVIKSFKTPYDTHISTIRNKKNNKKFIVKQDMRTPLSCLMCGVRDALGSYIARSIDIPANRVTIIPAGYSFPGKIKKHLPATLHTMVPGIMVSKLPRDLYAFRAFIYQPLATHISEEKWGLTRTVIENMAKHPDLARLTALDTFIANSDRHQKNYFYHQKTNRYIAIDLENSFKSDLASYACACVKSMIHDKQEQLSPEELCALITYKTTLEQLLNIHTPTNLYKKMLELSTIGNISPQVSSETVLKKLQIYRENIKNNYSSCKKLVRLLDKLIKAQS